MGSQIIKVSRDVDLYMEWSSIVESPTYIGRRADLAAYLAEPVATWEGTCTPSTELVEQRLERADRLGSSGRSPFGCRWDDHGEIYEQRGWLPRANMETFARLLLDAGDESADEQAARVAALIVPFEDAR